jgi:hypothetical protein
MASEPAPLGEVVAVLVLEAEAVMLPLLVGEEVLEAAEREILVKILNTPGQATNQCRRRRCSKWKRRQWQRQSQRQR